MRIGAWVVLARAAYPALKPSEALKKITTPKPICFLNRKHRDQISGMQAS